MSEISYTHIALIQIEKAIELYFSEELICALTLAGAGEEILGGILKSSSVINTHDQIIKNIQKRLPDFSYSDVSKNLNNTRNILKHFVEDQERLNLKPLDECVLLILRAISNYVKLENSKTDLMDRFIEDKKMNDTLEYIKRNY